MFDNLRTRVRSTEPDRYLQNSLFLGTKVRKSTREHTHQPSSIAITCIILKILISSNYFSVSFKPLIFSNMLRLVWEGEAGLKLERKLYFEVHKFKVQSNINAGYERFHCFNCFQEF